MADDGPRSPSPGPAPIPSSLPAADVPSHLAETAPPSHPAETAPPAMEVPLPLERDENGLVARPAKAPFDRPDADLVLCSSDHVLFRVYRAVLALGSSLVSSVLPTPELPHGATLV